MFRRRDRRAETDDTAEAAVSEIDGELEIESDDALVDQPEDMTADLESQAADYLAGNDVWMYGPNAEAVIEMLDRLEEIVPDEARPLSEAWLAIPKSDRDRARKAARKIALEDEETSRYLELAKEAVSTWLAVTGPYPEFVNADPNWGRIAAQTAEAALDATMAVILEGKLEESSYESLLEPWSATMAELDDAADAAKAEGASESPSDTQAAEDADEAADEGADEAEEAEPEFGPNTDTVTDFMNRLWLLAPDQVGRLVSSWQNADGDRLKEAHEALRALVDEDPEWYEQVRHAQEKLGSWLNAVRVEQMAGFLGQAGQGESRKMAGPALADAVAALVLGDLLDRRDAETLYAPWFNLIGAPELPEAEDEDESSDDAVAERTARPATKSGTKPAIKPAATPASATKSATKPVTRPAAKQAGGPKSALSKPATPAKPAKPAKPAATRKK